MINTAHSDCTLLSPFFSFVLVLPSLRFRSFVFLGYHVSYHVSYPFHVCLLAHTSTTTTPLCIFLARLSRPHSLPPLFFPFLSIPSVPPPWFVFLFLLLSNVVHGPMVGWTYSSDTPMATSVSRSFNAIAITTQETKSHLEKTTKHGHPFALNKFLCYAPFFHG